LILPAAELRSHSPSSSCRNRHWRPTLIAGISLHSAQRQTARVDIPSHFATAAVVNNGSKLDNDFAIEVLLPCDLFCGPIRQETAPAVRPLSGSGCAPDAGGAPGTDGHWPIPYFPDFSFRSFARGCQGCGNAFNHQADNGVL